MTTEHQPQIHLLNPRMGDGEEESVATAKKKLKIETGVFYLATLLHSVNGK